MYSTDTLLLAYRPELALLTACWLAEPTASQLHADYAAVLHAGKQYGSVRWLLDVRCLTIPTPTFANWVAQEWLPRAASALAPRRLRIACLMSLAHADALRLQPDLQPSVRAATAATLPYDFTLHMEEGSAMPWLLA